VPVDTLLSKGLCEKQTFERSKKSSEMNALYNRVFAKNITNVVEQYAIRSGFLQKIRNKVKEITNGY
jgi:hypothetical protein